MLNRLWKILLLAGFLAATASIGLALFYGSQFSYVRHGPGSDINIRIATGGSVLSFTLGVLGIAALMLGGALAVMVHRLGQSPDNPYQPADAAPAGSPAQPSSSPVPEGLAALHRLCKSEIDCPVTGVCGGLGENTAIPSWIWRALFLMLFFAYGFGLIAYVILYFAMPTRSMIPTATAIPADVTFKSFVRNLRKSQTDVQLGGVCGGLGEHSGIPAWLWRVAFLTLLFAGGAGLIAYIVLYLCMPEAHKKPAAA